MAIVEFEDRTLYIDAAVIGQGLNVEASLVQIRMREGKITVLCERGRAGERLGQGAAEN